AMRHAVIWRRISGGTDSERGSRFVERMLTVVATCRQQGRSVLDYLRSCFEAARSGQAIPSLLPVAQPKIKIACFRLFHAVHGYEEGRSMSTVLPPGSFYGEVQKRFVFGELTFVEATFLPELRVPRHRHLRPYFYLVLEGGCTEAYERRIQSVSALTL